MSDIFHKSNAPLDEDVVRAVYRMKESGERLMDEISFYAPEGRERDIAKEKLEECILWAVKGITK